MLVDVLSISLLFQQIVFLEKKNFFGLLSLLVSSICWLVGFHNISTLIGYLMPNPGFSYEYTKGFVNK